MGGPDDFFGQRDEVPQECLHKQHASWKWGWTGTKSMHAWFKMITWYDFIFTESLIGFNRTGRLNRSESWASMLTMRMVDVRLHRLPFSVSCLNLL
jgi:hypothetical protein